MQTFQAFTTIAISRVNTGMPMRRPCTRPLANPRHKHETSLTIVLMSQNLLMSEGNTTVMPKASSTNLETMARV